MIDKVTEHIKHSCVCFRFLQENINYSNRMAVGGLQTLTSYDFIVVLISCAAAVLKYFNFFRVSKDLPYILISLFCPVLRRDENVHFCVQIYLCCNFLTTFRYGFRFLLNSCIVGQ
jgi:hypothetical protein